MNRHIDKKAKVKGRSYERGEIQRLLQFTGVRDKAIILLLASSGIYIGVLHLIRKKHLF